MMVYDRITCRIGAQLKRIWSKYAQGFATGTLESMVHTAHPYIPRLPYPLVCTPKALIGIDPTTITPLAQTDSLLD